jgi:hypothetical protein
VTPLLGDHPTTSVDTRAAPLQGRAPEESPPDHFVQHLGLRRASSTEVGYKLRESAAACRDSVKPTHIYYQTTQAPTAYVCAH